MLCVLSKYHSPTIHRSALDLDLYSFYWSRVAREVLSAPSHSHREPDPQLWAPHHPGRVTRQALSKCHTQLYADSLSRVSTARNWQSLDSEHLAPEPALGSLSTPLPRVQLFPAFFLPRCCSRESASLLTSKVPKPAQKTALEEGGWPTTRHPTQYTRAMGVLPSSNTTSLTSSGPAFLVWPSWPALMGRLPHGDLGASCKLPF